MRTVEQMQDLGFDKTTEGEEGYLRIGCSQCEALVVNGVPTHERGCPNRANDCPWCGCLAPIGQKFCDESCYRAYHNLLEEEDE